MSGNVFSLAEVYRNVLENQDLVERRKMAKLARQQQEMQLADLQRQRDEQAKLKTSIASAFVTPQVQAEQAPMTLGGMAIPGGAGTTVKGPQQFDRQALVGSLVNNGLGDVALQYQGTFAAQDAAARKAALEELKMRGEIGKIDAETGKYQADTNKSETEVKMKHIEIVGQLAAPLAQLEAQGAPLPVLQQAYDRALIQAQQQGVPVAGAPPTYRPGIGKEFVDQAIQAKDRLTLQQQAEQQKEAARHNKAQEANASATLGETKRHNLETEDVAKTSAAAGKQGNITEGERNAGMFYSRAVDASKVIADKEPKLVQNGGGQAWRAVAPNVWQSDDAQSYEQGKRQWIQAILRKDSGAVISPSEFADADRTYFQQVGDSAATITRKQQARAEAEKALKVAAGRGAGQSGDAAPKVGEVKTFPNGRKGVWDGSGWVAQ